MDRIKEMQVFTRIADRGSFVLASEDLLIPRSTMTNIMKRMESRLGTRLLERTTRRVKLTQDGEEYYHRCLRLLADLDDMDASLLNLAPKGSLRINVQGTLAKHFVMPKISEFKSRFPDIIIHIAEDDRLVDLISEGIDCVLRAGELKSSSLVAKKLVKMEQVTVASPAYLSRHTKIQSLEQLNTHLAVGYSLDSSSKPCTLEFIDNDKIIEVTLPANIYVAGADLYTSAALADFGLIQVPKYRIEKELNDNKLVCVLPDNPPPPMQVSVLYPQNKHLSPRTRVFINWLSGIFSINNHA